MFCHKCGTQLIENTRYCSNCGSEVPLAEPPAPIQPEINHHNTAGLSKRMTILFWIIWSLFLLIDLTMLMDQFSWTRCIVLLGIQVGLVYWRNKLFGKTLIALSVWSITLIIVLATIAYTGVNEEMAFKQYKDYQQENKAALKVLDAFAEAANKGDVKNTVSLIEESRQRSREIETDCRSNKRC